MTHFESTLILAWAEKETRLTVTFDGHLGGHGGRGAGATAPGASDPEPAPDILSALQSQLGLRLEHREVTVEGNGGRSHGEDALRELAL